MAPGKRGREPLEASAEHHRAQKKARVPNPPVQTNQKPTRFQARQHPENVEPLLELPNQGGKPRPKPRVHLTLSPPHPPHPSQADSNDPGSSASEVSTCYSQEVENYDVGPGVEAQGVPNARDMEYWGRAEQIPRFIRSQSGIEGNWVGVKPLGVGGMGVTGLWERRGDDGQMVEQMVIKEEWFMKEQWDSNEEIRGVRPEVKIMSKLNKKRCHAIPRLFNYKRYPLVGKQRIYMEYCPFQDLSVLRSRYGRFRRYLPEPFLWETFYHLVEALVAMRYDSDFEIVHRDIKPGNVFLGYENADKGFPFYPVAKLGDYGLATMTNRDDPKNPAEYRGWGTPGYKAPEQQQYTESEDQLSSYTNVWGIGVIMFELLTFHEYPDYMEDPENHINGMIIETLTDKQPEYSETLRNLIVECVHPIPMERIELDRLRERIKSYRDRMHRDYMETDDDGRAEFESENLLYYIQNEINNMPTTGELYPTKPPLQSAFPDPDYPIFPPRFSDEEEIYDGPEAVNDFWDEVEDAPEALNDFEDEIYDAPEALLDFEEEIEVAPEALNDFEEEIEDAPQAVQDLREEIEDAPQAVNDVGEKVEDAPKPEKDLRIYNRKRPDNPFRHRYGHLIRSPILYSSNDADDEWGGRFFRKRTPQSDHVAADDVEGTDDESVAMDLESEDEDEMSADAPALAPAPVIQAPAPAPAPLLAPAVPAPVIQAPAPAPAPAPQPVPRTLRSGRIFGFY